MDWRLLPYLTPYLLSLLISSGVAITCWNRSAVKGARPYGWAAFGQALWTGGYIFELLSSTLEQKIFWDDFQWVGSMLSLAFFPGAILETIGNKWAGSLKFWVVMIVLPVIFMIILPVPGLRFLIQTNARLVEGTPFSALEYDFGPLTLTLAIYTILISLILLGTLIKRLIKAEPLYRPQLTAIMLGLVIPIIGIILTTAGVQLGFQRDSSPMTFAIGNIFVAWGLFRLRLFKKAPVARDLTFENMADPVLVIDNEDRIVDINQAALSLLGVEAKQVLGHAAAAVFVNHPQLLKPFLEEYPVRTEGVVMEGEQERHFEISVSSFSNRHGRLVGRIVVAREITERVRLQERLLRSNEQLEERVDERTRELEEAYDTTLEGWARALELRDEETTGHSRRVTDLTIDLARLLGVPHEDLIHIRRGAILHDIGKMAIPDEILRKKGPLSKAEHEIINRHPGTALELLDRIPYLKKALEIPYSHHEKWDGTGYPLGLAGEQIPLAARIFTVVDVWDAVQSDRPYKKAWTHEQALAYIRDQAGKDFDPQVVTAFLELVADGRN